MGHRAARLVCWSELWGASQPSSPPAPASPWSSVDLGLPPSVHFIEKLETEFGKPGWDETHQKAGRVRLLAIKVLRSWVFEVQHDFAAEREQDSGQKLNLGFIGTGPL